MGVRATEIMFWAIFFGVSPNDPMAFAVAAVILPAVAILAVLVLTALRQS